MDSLMKELQPSTVTPGDSDYAFGVGNKYQGLSRQEFKMTIVLECFLVLYQEVHLVPGLNRTQSVSTLHRLQTCPSCRCSYRQPHITNLPLGQALFGRLEDQSGIADANYFLLQAALLEERINDGAEIAEEGLELARKSGNKLDEVKMLRASLLVKLAEGKPLDALEIAAKAEGLLVTLEKNHKEAGEVLLLVAQAHMLQGTTVGQQAALNAALQAVDHFAKAEEGRGEADSWRVVGDARVALGKFEDGLRATEAAMVICVDCGDEVGQALCLLSLSKAHLVRGLPLKAKKASEKALNLFHEQSSDLLAAAALEILVQALIGQEQRKEALQRAKQELLSFLGSGDKWAVPRMRGRGVLFHIFYMFSQCFYMFVPLEPDSQITQIGLEYGEQ